MCYNWFPLKIGPKKGFQFSMGSDFGTISTFWFIVTLILQWAARFNFFQFGPSSLSVIFLVLFPSPPDLTMLTNCLTKQKYGLAQVTGEHSLQDGAPVPAYNTQWPLHSLTFNTVECRLCLCVFQVNVSPHSWFIAKFWFLNSQQIDLSKFPEPVFPNKMTNFGFQEGRKKKTVFKIS